MKLYELEQQRQEILKYQVHNDKYSSANASVKRRSIQEVFTCAFSEAECRRFERIFREYLNIDGGQCYEKLKQDLLIESRRYYELNDYPAIQCMLYCSKCVISKRFDKKLVKTLSDVIDNILQYTQFEDCKLSIMHIVTNWVNWIPQLKVAIRVSYKMDDIDFLSSIYDSMFSDDEFFWEVFFMLIRSGKSVFIPIIIDNVISASTDTDRNKQTRNLFKRYFTDYYNRDEAIKYYKSKYGNENQRYLGTGQFCVEDVLKIGNTRNELLARIRTMTPKRQILAYVEQIDQLKSVNTTLRECKNVFIAASNAPNNVKAEIAPTIHALLICKNENNAPVSIIKEIIYRLALYRYDDAQVFIQTEYGNKKEYVGAVAFYNLYISRINSEQFVKNYIVQQNDVIVRGYAEALKKLCFDEEITREMSMQFIICLNAIVNDRLSNRFPKNVSTAILNLKAAIHANNLIFDRKMKSIFEVIFGFENNNIEPLVDIDCQIAILDIIDTVISRHNIFEDLLFCLYDGREIAAVLKTKSGGILTRHGKKAIPVKEDNDDRI